MKRYRFPLEGVLRVRRLQEQTARAELAAANRAVAEAYARMNDRLDHYLRVRAGQGDGELNGFLAVRQRQQLAAAATLAAGGAHRDAEEQATAVRRRWTEAAQRVEALERLDERRRAEHRLAAERAEAAEVDDLVVGRAARRAARQADGVRP